MKEPIEIYVIEKYDKIKDCYIFWTIVSSYQKAKEYIYKYMTEWREEESKISIRDGQVNEYDYFTASCNFANYPTITDKFRGHSISLAIDTYFL